MTPLEDKPIRCPPPTVKEARQRTLALVADLDDEQLSIPLMEIVNPFLWELGHTAFFYEAFLLRVLDAMGLRGMGVASGTWQPALSRRRPAGGLQSASGATPGATSRRHRIRRTRG